MVASSLSPPAKTPSLSYAERAKKAQNIRSPIEVVQSHSSRISQPQPSPLSLAPSLSSTSNSSAKSPSALLPSTSSVTSVSSTAAPPPPPPLPTLSETKILNGDSTAPSISPAKPQPVPEAQSSPQRPPPVNVWDRRKEEFAARNASTQKSTITALPQPSTSTSRSTAIASTSSSSENLSQNDNANPTSETKPQPSSSSVVDDDDDPFVVRTSRAPRPHIPVPPAIFSTDSAEDWPEVGKSAAPSNSTEIIKTEEPRASSGDSTQSSAARKGGATKWIPLPLQAPAEVQSQPRRDPQTMRGNRQSTNNSRPSSNYGQGRNSRNQSGRNSANQSASHSRVHSNAGSAQSSPRNPRNRRLPSEEAPVAGTNGPTNRSSRTGSPLPMNLPQGPSSFPQTDIAGQASNYGGYLSPPHGPAPYYPQQPPNLPPVGSPIYRSPSHAPPLGLPDPSLSMPPPVHGYPYVYQNPYIPGPYDYMPPSAPYPYWNGHHSHPGSGQHSPAYPPPATSSSYAAALPLHVQQHFYPPPTMQPQPSAQSQPHSSVSNVPQPSSTASSASERGSAGKLSPVGGPDVAMAVPPSFGTELKANGDIARSTSVVFGSIDVPTTVQPSASAEASPTNNIEKVFKSLAIGIDATDAAPKPRKPIKPNKGPEKEDHHVKAVNGDITLDPVLARKAESETTGETRWKFGNEGLASPAGGAVIDVEAKAGPGLVARGSLPVMDEELGEEFKVKNFGFGFGIPGGDACATDVAKDDPEVTQKEKITVNEREGEERAETSGLQPPREQGSGRPRRGSAYGGGYGYDRGGYGARRARGMNGFGRGHSRGYGRGGGGHHSHSGNSYQQRQGPPPFNVTPPLPFQGIPTHPLGGPDGGYYGAPPRAPLATYIPTGYDPYVPQPPPPQPPVSGQPAPGGHAVPPMPMPLSQLTFPLDGTRFYLLGQLEYYLSPQNMAQDFFLRKHMDSEGWISIDLLASFNRVKRLTQDHQLVREVLTLSHLVQVRDGFARMGGWEQFVLPDAPQSMVLNEEDYSSYIPQHQHPHHHVQDGSLSGVQGMSQDGQQWINSGVDGEVDEEVEEEEEEDDVVFVMGGHEVEGMWSHEKRT